MYKLTNQQKIANLTEVRTNLQRKKENLEKQIQGIDSKIKLLQEKIESNTEKSVPDNLTQAELSSSSKTPRIRSRIAQSSLNNF